MSDKKNPVRDLQIPYVDEWGDSWPRRRVIRGGDAFLSSWGSVLSPALYNKYEGVEIGSEPIDADTIRFNPQAIDYNSSGGFRICKNTPKRKAK